MAATRSRAPMPKRDRATLDQVLQGAFRGAGSETTLVGWTAMGLYELTRKRDRVPLARLAAASGSSSPSIRPLGKDQAPRSLLA